MRSSMHGYGDVCFAKGTYVEKDWMKVEMAEWMKGWGSRGVMHSKRQSNM
jgi:hypothetical protein